jgi:hypothetical protein
MPIYVRAHLIYKTGFTTGKVGGLNVSLNQRATADLTLQVATTSQTVDVVSGGTDTIDLSSTTVGANLNETLYKNVAAGRNISSIINFAPGVTASQGAGFANPSINGASGLENEYIINGSDVTDSGYGGFGTYSPIFGSLGSGVNFDFIQEVQVKTGGFEAQYGQALGGVVNVITKSGSNTLHGSLYGYLAPHSLRQHSRMLTLCWLRRAIIASIKAPTISAPISAGRLRKTSCSSMAESIQLLPAATTLPIRPLPTMLSGRRCSKPLPRTTRGN